MDKSRESSKSTQQVKQAEKDFKSLLSEKLNQAELRFSSHATKRLSKRGIDLNMQDIQSLKNAVDLAESKGSRDTLVLHDKAAFVVSVKNRTVITAIDHTNMQERIVTNIDSAIIARDIPE